MFEEDFRLDSQQPLYMIRYGDVKRTLLKLAITGILSMLVTAV